MKKLLLTLSAALCAAALCTSCDSMGIGTPKMDTAEATAMVVENLNKNINFDEWKLYEVRWMEGEELENDLTLLSVGMVNKAGDCFTQSFNLSGAGKGHASDLREAIGQDKIDFEAVNGITPAMIDPAAIQQQYEAAKSMLPEGYTFKSISSYVIEEAVPSGNTFLDRDKKLGEVTGQFAINMTENGKEVIESAGKQSIQYYEMDFNVLPDGSIEIDE